MNAWSHSANPFLDNYYRSYAQDNAKELAELLTRENAPVRVAEPPSDS